MAYLDGVLSPSGGCVVEECSVLIITTRCSQPATGRPLEMCNAPYTSPSPSTFLAYHLACLPACLPDLPINKLRWESPPR